MSAHDAWTAIAILASGFGFYWLFGKRIIGSARAQRDAKVCDAAAAAEGDQDGDSGPFQPGNPDEAPDFAKDTMTVDYEFLHNLWLSGFASGSVTAIMYASGDQQTATAWTNSAMNAMVSDPAVLETVSELIRARIADPSLPRQQTLLKVFSPGGGPQ